MVQGRATIGLNDALPSTPCPLRGVCLQPVIPKSDVFRLVGNMRTARAIIV